MPDLSDYTDPFSRAAQAMQGNRAMPPGPINPNPEPRRRRSLFDDPALQELAGRLGTGTPGYLPAEMQPLGDEGSSVPPLVAAVKGRGQAAPSALAGMLGGAAAAPAMQPTERFRDEDAVTAPSTPKMMLTIGGGQPTAMPTPGDKDYVPPAPQAGTYYGPNNQYGMGPYRSDAELKAAGTGNPIRDRLLAMLDQAPPSATLWSNPGGRDQPNPNFGAELAAYQGKLGSLNELMKSQSEDEFKKQHLGLEREKLDLAKAEAGPVAREHQQWVEKRARQEAALQAQGILAGTPAFQTRMAQYEDANPEPRKIAPGPGPGGMAPAPAPGQPAAMPTITQPAAAQPPAATAGGRAKGFSEKGVPLDLQEMMNKDSGDHKQTPLEEFMTHLYKRSQVDPNLSQPGAIGKVIAEMQNQYGKDKVASALEPGQFMGMDAEVLGSGARRLLNRANPFATRADLEAAQIPAQARAAIRNQMAGNPKGGVPANQPMPESWLQSLGRTGFTGANSLYGGLEDYLGAVAGGKEKMRQYQNTETDFERGMQELGRRLGIK